MAQGRLRRPQRRRRRVWTRFEELSRRRNRECGTEVDVGEDSSGVEAVEEQCSNGDYTAARGYCKRQGEDASFRRVKTTAGAAVTAAVTLISTKLMSIEYFVRLLE
jgi:hypothetical protein